MVPAYANNGICRFQIPEHLPLNNNMSPCKPQDLLLFSIFIIGKPSLMEPIRIDSYPCMFGILCFKFNFSHQQEEIKLR